MNHLRRLFAFSMMCLVAACAAPAGPDLTETDYLPVERYYSQLLKSSPELQAYDAELNKVWKKFYASFSPVGSPSSKRLALEWYRKCRIAGQKSLDAYIGDEAAFIQKQLEQVYVVEYMGRVADLAKNPSAELQFLLSGMICHSKYDNKDCEPSAVLGALALAAYGPVPPDEIAAKALARYGYSPSGPASFVYGRSEGKSELSINDLGDDKATNIVSYTMEGGADGVFYGYRGGVASNRFRTVRGIYGDFTMIKGGRIHFLLLDEPEEKYFFLNSPEGEVWKYRAEPDASGWVPSYKPCEMALRFHPAAPGDFSSITAELYQINFGHYDLAWHCIPQCTLPYKLGENVYQRQAPDCMIGGAWGAKAP